MSDITGGFGTPIIREGFYTSSGGAMIQPQDPQCDPDQSDDFGRRSDAAFARLVAQEVGIVSCYCSYCGSRVGTHDDVANGAKCPYCSDPWEKAGWTWA